MRSLTGSKSLADNACLSLTKQTHFACFNLIWTRGICIAFPRRKTPRRKKAEPSSHRLIRHYVDLLRVGISDASTRRLCCSVAHELRGPSRAPSQVVLTTFLYEIAVSHYRIACICHLRRSTDLQQPREKPRNRLECLGHADDAS